MRVMDWLRGRKALFGGEHFGAGLTVSPNSEHPFMGPEDAAIVGAWLGSVVQKTISYCPDSPPRRPIYTISIKIG